MSSKQLKAFNHNVRKWRRLMTSHRIPLSLPSSPSPSPTPSPSSRCRAYPQEDNDGGTHTHVHHHQQSATHGYTTSNNKNIIHSSLVHEFQQLKRQFSLHYRHDQFMQRRLQMRLHKLYQTIYQTLCKRRMITLTNLLVIFLVLWQFLSMLLSTSSLTLKKSNNVYLFRLTHFTSTSIPFPLNLSPLMGKPVSASARTAPAFPGYAGIRTATFRNRYPSVSAAGTGTFDSVFVITSLKCKQHWNSIVTRARALDVPITKWPISSHVSISVPPLPISFSARVGVTPDTAVLRRSLAYTDAHIRLWRHIVLHANVLQRVLVMDDTLFPTNYAFHLLPPMMANVDVESVAKSQPWHMLFLRRTSTIHNDEIPWSVVPKYGHIVTRANVSHGVSVYVLSTQGAQFLLDHVKTFRAPLDVQIAMVQREHASEFVALSACDTVKDRPFCPKLIEDLSSKRNRTEDPGAYSFDCTWRRAQEVQTAGGFEDIMKLHVQT